MFYIEGVELLDALAFTYFLLERNPNNRAGRDFARHFNYEAPDRIPQDVFDCVLWQSVHGAGSRPPVPGPNAARGQ